MKILSYIATAFVLFSAVIAFTASDMFPSKIDIELELPEPNMDAVSEIANLPPETVETDPVDLDEVKCMQANLYFEAANRGYMGKLAVASVTMTRVLDDRYPDTVCGVVYQSKIRNGVIVPNACQFSWYCDGQTDTPELRNSIDSDTWKLAYEIAYDVVSGQIMLDIDATHYHTITSAPTWSTHERMIHVKTVGDHDFYREIPYREFAQL